MVNKKCIVRRTGKKLLSSVTLTNKDLLERVVPPEYIEIEHSLAMSRTLQCKEKNVSAFCVICFPCETPQSPGIGFVPVRQLVQVTCR